MSAPVYDGNAWVNHDLSLRWNNVWEPFAQAWYARVVETEPGVFETEWDLFYDADIPQGPKPLMTQTQLQDGPVEQSWTNPGGTSEYQTLIRLYVNDVVVDTQLFTTPTSLDEWPEGNFSDGDKIQGSVQYRVHPTLTGPESELSDAIFYTGS